MSLSSLSPGDRREVLAAIRKGRTVSDARLTSATCDEASRLGRLYRWSQRIWAGMAVLGVVQIVTTVTGTPVDGRITGPIDVVLGSLLTVIYRRLGKRAKQAEQANAVADDSA